MSLERLKNDLNEMNISYEIVLVPLNDELTYKLTDLSPANIGHDGRIYVMERLNEQEKSEAIAHELGHLYYKNLGQVTLENFEDQHNLPLEINNVISHMAIIDWLERTYGIASTAHIIRRATLLEEAEQYLVNLEKSYLNKDIDCLDYDYYLATLGVYLRDIEMCLPNRQDQVNYVAALHPRLSLILNAARIHLFNISVNFSEEEQKRRINAFIMTLRFDIGEFIFQ